MGRIQNEEFRKLYLPPNIIRVIKSRRMSWMEHVARMGKITNSYILLENAKGGDHSEDLVVDGKVISEWILGK
jgi:hypothetical protein